MPEVPFPAEMVTERGMKVLLTISSARKPPHQPCGTSVATLLCTGLYQNVSPLAAWTGACKHSIGINAIGSRPAAEHNCGQVS